MPFAGLFGGGNGGKDDVLIAVADERGAVGLLGKLAGLDDQLPPADLE